MYFLDLFGLGLIVSSTIGSETEFSNEETTNLFVHVPEISWIV